MKRNITTTAVVALALTTSMGLAACGRSTDTGAKSTDTAATVSSGKATGTITIWAMGAEGDNLPKLTKDFEAANPGVKVEVTAVPWDSAHDKFKTAITAGKTPDAAMVGTTWMGEFAQALDPTPATIDKSLFFEGAQKTTEVAGTSYGVPWYVETRLVYYRKDLAAKAGITTLSTDWAGLKAMAKAMQDKAGAKWGINLQAGGQGSWQTILPFAWSNGAEVATADQKTFTFDTPETAEAVKYYQSYFTDGISLPKAAAEGSTEPNFVNGSVPMFISGPWMMGAVEKVGGADFKAKYGVMPMPKQKTATSFVGGSDLVVFKTSKNRDGAWKLVQWLSDPATQVKWYGLSTDLPSVKSAWQDPALTADEKLAVFGKQLEDAKAPPAIATWEEVASAFDSEMEKVTKSGLDPATALKAVQVKADSIGTGG